MRAKCLSRSSKARVIALVVLFFFLMLHCEGGLFEKLEEAHETR